MKTLMFLVVGIGIMVSGCRSIEVVNHGEEAVRNAAGEPVLSASGEVQKISRGWEVSHFQHWMITAADNMSASVKPNDISFAINGLNSRPDGTNIVGVIDASFSGANRLAATIAAYIGGGTVTDAAWSAAKNLYDKFVAAGGDPDAATVECKNGTCTITDGTVCADGKCSD